MTTDRLAALFRSFSILASRRGLSRALAGLAVTGMLGPLCGPVGVEAKRRRKKKRKPKQTLTSPPAPPPSPPPCVCGSGCPFTTVQAAVDAASPGATITICAGNFNGNVNINKNLTLIGAGEGASPATNTILNGVTAGVPVVWIRAGRTVTLQDLRITGGATLNIGAGLINQGTLTLTACTVTENFAGNWGGGLANLAEGAVTLFGSSVTGNHAGAEGGGIYNEGTVTCSGGSTVSGNTVGDPPVTSNCIDVSSGSGCASCPV